MLYKENELPGPNKDLIFQYVARQLVTQGRHSSAARVPYRAIRASMKVVEAKAEKFISIIRAKNFGLLFQPVINISTLDILYFESLARFKKRESPADIIVFAEETGVVGHLDLAVCSAVVKKLRHMRYYGGRFPISVNISGRSIESDEFVEMYTTILKNNTDISDDLFLEVTETFKIADLERANNIIQRIQALGFKVCLDDFGSGAASFQYLRELSVDTVKIDGAYIRKLGQSPRDDAMLRCVVGTCRDLGVEIIAEHVETKRQSQLLAELGISFAQGWYYGAPAPDLTWPVPSDGKPESLAYASTGL